MFFDNLLTLFQEERRGENRKYFLLSEASFFRRVGEEEGELGEKAFFGAKEKLLSLEKFVDNLAPLKQERGELNPFLGMLFSFFLLCLQEGVGSCGMKKAEFLEADQGNDPRVDARSEIIHNFLKSLFLGEVLDVEVEEGGNLGDVLG